MCCKNQCIGQKKKKKKKKKNLTKCGRSKAGREKQKP